MSLLHFTHDGSLVSEGPQTDPMEKLQGRSKVKIATDKKDDTRVLKVVDAIKCVEDFLNGDVVKSVLMAVLKGQIADDIGPINGAFDAFALNLTTCIRSKALGQAIPRVTVRVTPPRGRGRPKGAKNGSKDVGYTARRRGARGAGS
jgi:hypothetical protein